MSPIIDQQPNQPNNKPQNQLILGVVVAGVVVLAFAAAWIINNRQQPTSTLKSSSTVAVTPADYSSFIGRVSAINGSVVSVDFNLTDEAGQLLPIKYQVTIDQTTAIQKRVWQNGTDETTAAILTDFSVGDTVLVASELNLYQQRNFTATNITKLIS